MRKSFVFLAFVLTSLFYYFIIFKVPKISEQTYSLDSKLKHLYGAQVKAGPIRDCFWIFTKPGSLCKRSYRSWIKDALGELQPSKRFMRTITFVIIGLISAAKVYILLAFEKQTFALLGLIFGLYCTRLPLIAAYSPADLLGLLLLGCAIFSKNRKVCLLLLSISVLLLPAVYPVAITLGLMKSQGFAVDILLLPAILVVLGTFNFWTAQASVHSVALQLISFALAGSGYQSLSLLTLVFQCLIKGYRDPLALALSILVSLEILKRLKG